MPTPNEIEKLKQDWLADPCWDIEDSEGFEEHRDALATFAKEHRAKWEKLLTTCLVVKAEKIGCTSLKLTQYLTDLEDRLDKLENLQQQ